MKFQAGQSGNPSGLPRGQSKGGRPKGSVGGRMQALVLLDKILGKRKSQRSLTTALETELKKNPLGFFKTIIMPLLPKESKLAVTNDGIVEWKTLVEAFPKPGLVVQALPKPEVPAPPATEE